MANVTDANDLRIVLSEVDGNTEIISASIVINEFEFEESQDKPLQHGVGNEEPVGRVTGNKEWTFTFTITGEDADLFDMVADDDTLIDAVATGVEYKWTIKDLDHTNFTYGASDGEGVEFSAELNALGLKREAL